MDSINPLTFPALCPANPTSEHFTSTSDVMFESITMSAMKKDGTFNLLKEHVSITAIGYNMQKNFC